MTKITLTSLKSDVYKSSVSWFGHLSLFILLLSAQFSSAQVAVIENFNGALPAGWTSTLYSTTVAPCEGTAAFRTNLYAFNLAAAITTSNYVGVSNGTDVTVNFQWKTTEYSLGSGIGVTANVEYSINDGATWLAAGPAINSSAITACAMYSSTIPAASVPLNSDFKFRIAASQTSGDFYFYLDQFSITQTTTVAPQCTTLVSPANGAVDVSSSVITWSPAAGIPTGYTLSVGTTAGGTEVVNAVDVGNVTTYTLPALGSSTTYYVRVVPYNANGSATACTESTFTSCGAVTVLPWTENFDSMTTLGNFYPGCWFMENGAWMTGTALSNTYTDPRSGANYLFNNWGAINEYIWTKGFSLTAGTSYDFSTFVQGDNGTSWVVDMFVNNSQSSTAATQLGGSYNVPGTGAPYVPQTYAEMRRTFVPTTTGIYYFAVRVNEPTSGPWYLGFDDFRLELTPSCVAPIGLSATNATFTTATINWNASPSAPANGYQYFYSTTNTTPADSATPSGSVAAGITTASLSGLSSDTTYYFWVRSVCDGTTSSAWGGPGTFFTGYCQSNPSSNDANGVTNVQLGTTNFPTGDVTYIYHATPIVDFAQGINSNVQVTFATGYTYMTTIWIDFNDNLIFDASEQVFTGVSAAPNPSTLNASFVMPAGAALGQHRMRIGTQDNEFATPSPCYSGAYGITLDFNVNIVTASCSPAAATASIVPNCANNEYSIAVDVTNLGSGTPTLVYGSSSLPLTSTGTVTIGPFANSSNQILSITHGSDAACDVSLGSFTYNCPPANNNCGSAIALTPGATFASNPVTGTNTAATGSVEPTPITCFGYNGGDIWYSVAVPDSGSITIETGAPTTGTGIDTVITAYTGSCGNLIQEGCNDDGAGNAYSLVSLVGLTPGEMVYIRVYEYGNNAEGSFAISAYDASLSTNSFNNANFTYYPNPVKDVLNLSYNKDITSVAVFNLIGQQVISTEFNATNGQLDMSKLSSGAYIVKVTSENATKSIKVIKE